MTLALLITAVGGAWAQTEESEAFTMTTAGQKVYTGTHVKITATNLFDSGEIQLFREGQQATIETLNGETITKIVVTASKNPQNCDVVKSTSGTVEGGNPTSTIKDVNATSVVISSQFYVGISQITVYYTGGASSGPEVTINEAKSEATMEMPASDITVTYELVRDMGYKVAFSGVPTRARLAKDDNGKFHFADGLTFQLLDNIDAANPKDITSAEGITFMVGEMVPFEMEGNTYYQLNKETLVPLADFLADAHLGNYAICAVASTGEYDGSFSSGRIELFQGYEVEVAAKEFITYYKDEPLRVEDEAAELYTIESVNGDRAVLSDRSDAMPSNTPMLVYNKSNETKVILLIPCAEPDMAITVAPEFQGTLTGTTIAASTDAQTNYALNGKQFVFVKNDLAIGPNKAWLSVNTGVPSARITIVFDEATGVNEVIGVNGVNDDTFYDLNGRKVAVPNKKGIYIKNGKKVVVK